MKFKTVFFAVALLLSAVSVLHAKERLENFLPTYLELAAENNGELYAAFARWKAAIQKAPQVSSLPDPQLNFGVYIVPVETRVGPQRLSYGLSQKIPWPGKLSAKEEVALRESDILKAKADSIKARIFKEVKVAYYELAYLNRAIELTSERIELLDYLESVIRARYSAGNALYADVLRSQVELDTSRNRKRSLEDLRSPLTARLNALMGRKYDEPVRIDNVIAGFELKVSDDQLRTWLESQNPELLNYEQQVASASAQIKVAEKNYYPDVTLGITSIYTDDARTGDPSQNGRDPVIASVGINLPIWLDSRNAAVEEGKEKRVAALKGKTGRKDILMADLEFVLFQYRDELRQKALYQDSLLPKAEQSVKVTMQAYQSGQVDLQEFISAETTYFDLYLAYARVLANQAQRIAQLEQLVGTELPVAQVHTPVSSEFSLPEEELKTQVN
ncbi:TolC family protein [Halodesulfovibrio aestuarii]|uniref:TolC family protein n=1 Tax=Halodesulfovibrio aestuarii TaxID=126333 RepID=UPI003D348CBF